MPTNPYDPQRNAYGGAQGNGYQGSQTSGSQGNAAQQAKTGGNPAQSFGGAAQSWAQVLQGYMNPQAQAAVAPQPGYTPPPPTSGPSYQDFQRPQLTPEQQAAELSERARQSQIPGNAGNYANDPRFDPAMDAQRSAALAAYANSVAPGGAPGWMGGSEGLSPSVADATSFSGKKAFSPGMSSNNVIDGPGSLNPGDGGGPPGGTTPPPGGQGAIPPSGTTPRDDRPPLTQTTPVEPQVPGPTGFKEIDPLAKPPGTEDPEVAAKWYSNWIPGITAADVTEFRNWELQRLEAGAGPTRIEDWWRQGKPLAYRGDSQFTDPSLRSGGGGPPPGWKGYPGQNEQPKPTPPGGDGPTTIGMPEGAGPGPLTGGVGPDGKPIAEHGDPNKGDWSGFDDQTGDLQSILRDLMGPQFEYEQNQLTRHARAQAALTGQQDSGGFGENLSAAQAQLGANQGARMSDYLFNASEAEKGRNANMAIAKMQDDLARFQIDTNDKLQRYLQANELEMQKYGIDTQDLWQRYQAELQLQGVQVGANAQIQAASLQAAAAGAAAAAALQARKYETDINAGLEGNRLAQARELGILGINRDIYQTDVNDRYRYAYLQWLMSPEARMGGGLPFTPPGQFPF